MAAILHALQGILTIVIMIATGFYLSRKGWFSESFSSAVAQLVTLSRIDISEPTRH